MNTITNELTTARLKTETLDNHRQLEKIIIDRLKNILRTVDYIRLLSGFYGFIEPLEKEIAPFLNADFLPDFENRRKSNWLLEDMQVLGGEFCGELCRSLPEIANLKGAAGAMYVLEGSTLGGQIIKKMLQKQLEFPNGDGLHYFNSYGDETKAHWETFTNALNAMDLPTNEQDAVIEAANETFEAFGTYLNLRNGE